MLLQRGVVGEHLEAGLTDVAGRLRVALPMLLEEGEGGGHKLAGGAGQAGGQPVFLGLVVAYSWLASQQASWLFVLHCLACIPA